MNIIPSASPRDIDREFGNDFAWRGAAPAKLQCESGRPGLGSSKHRLRTPARAGHPRNLQLDETPAVNRKRDVLNTIHDDR